MRTHKLVKVAGPDDLVFESVQTGKPMNDQNILKRHIQPAARRLGLAFVNWRCLPGPSGSGEIDLILGGRKRRSGRLMNASSGGSASARLACLFGANVQPRSFQIIGLRLRLRYLLTSRHFKFPASK